jgi:hypothetical protein
MPVIMAVHHLLLHARVTGFVAISSSTALVSAHISTGGLLALLPGDPTIFPTLFTSYSGREI